MTLGRQLILSGLLVLAGLFLGMILFTVDNTQKFLNQQLASHSQDTATVLGLSLTNVMKDNDVIVADRMVDSIWDSGYYQSIEVESLNGAPLVSKFMEVKVHGVPDWFIGALALETEKKEALIQSGWLQVGKVYVESNPGFAYKQIWETFTDSLIWFCVIAVVALGLGVLLLHIILKPLREVTKQAYAICNQEFLIQEKLPWTLDLRQVVKAMNKMSTRLKAVFEEQARATENLREQAFQSQVTGLGNRRYFDMIFGNLTTDESQGSSGTLLLLELYDFKGFNDEQGYEKGDALLKEVAAVLKDKSSGIELAHAAHLGGANFALLMPRQTVQSGKEIGERILEAFAEFQERGILTTSNVGHIGICHFMAGEIQTEILSKTDVALRKAQSEGPNKLTIHEHATSIESQGAREWGSLFKRVIENNDITIHFQPYKIFHTLRDELHYEALIRITDQEGVLLTAGQFMPMAERLQQIPNLDRLVISKVCEEIRSDLQGRHYSFNLSASSLEDKDFRKYLLKAVKGLGKSAKQLTVELPEYGVLHRLDLVRDLFKKIRAYGASTAIDHYGQNFTSFGYLHSLNVSYLKIDGSFVREISKNEDNQFFIRSLINIAHSLDIQVIAEAVETEEELQILKRLKVDGVQGYLIGKPSEIV